MSAVMRTIRVIQREALMSKDYKYVVQEWLMLKPGSITSPYTAPVFGWVDVTEHDEQTLALRVAHKLRHQLANTETLIQDNEGKIYEPLP